MDTMVGIMTECLKESNCLTSKELAEIKTSEDLIKHINHSLSDQCLDSLQHAFAEKLAQGVETDN